MATDEDHYYVALGEGRYRPTVHAQGAWQATEQHMAPVSGLLMHALERHDPRPDLQWARISFDILGMIHLEETAVRTRTLRPGRTIELVEATASAGGRDVVRATAWRLATTDTSAVATVELPALPAPESVEPWAGMQHWGGGFISSLEFREVPGGRAGRRAVWVGTQHPLVAGEDWTPLAGWVGRLDTANGIAIRESPQEWLFPNVDLTLHLHRTPVGGWLGLQAEVHWGPTGLGQTSSVAYDVDGPVGTVEQALTIRPR
ncbi:thioesterase family protein [Ornithinimicrobium cerasi]|uniref:Thioesterase-like superfamily protein n=1 Tax=Ornithinimicrobium cerasi TaxID=2248773 RepID=A0A285VS17_9MICO|nr:thioesterase family protein [Ornithinimicrobium cerasi]SOC56870.1 Thioesterase-like superfamily protein [Ornithinimicrobium cerasi]